MELTPIHISVFMFAVNTVSLVLAYNKIRNERIELEAKQRERIVALETKISVFWDALARDAAKILHTPHPENARRDALLEKFLAQTISREELAELIGMLKAIIDEKWREMGERTAASNMLRALERQYEI